MKVLFDIGNSRLKWQLRRDRCVLASGVAARYLDDESCAEILAAVRLNVQRGGVRRVWVASVAAPEVTAQLVDWCQQCFAVDCEIVRVESELAGVRAAYRELANLGVDRWLALLAVRAEFSEACMVIDAGTALTMDLLAADGRHVGGIIAPGLKTLSRALFSDTARVSFDRLSYRRDAGLGGSTRGCVESGVNAFFAGGIAQVLHEQRDHFSRLIVAGGDGELVGQMFSSWRPLLRQQLVFDGLQVWAEQYR